MAVIARNVRGFPVSFLNIRLLPAEEIRLDFYFSADAISNDSRLQILIGDGDVVINDGEGDLLPDEALSLVVAVRSVNNKSGDVILDPDDLDDTATNNKFYPEADSLKLAAIQENADATDAINVEAAGAVMENDISTALMGFVIDDPTMIAATSTNLNTAASTKEYVDTTIAAQITGANNYRGGYNASTNSPDLEAPLAEVVKVGHVYDVVNAGTFTPAGGGSHELEIGDTLRAKVDDPSTAADWVVVQSNLTSASIKSRYESNADTNAFTDAEQAKLAGIEVNATEDQVAAEVPFTPAGNTTSNNVQLAIQEVQTDLDGVRDDTILNTAKVSADGSVTTHSDITDAGSGAIITTTERTKVGHISVTQAVDLDSIESDTNTNNAKVTNATHSGDASGDAALTLQPAAITGKPSAIATVEGADLFLLSDNSDSGNLKQTTLNGIIADPLPIAAVQVLTGDKFLMYSTNFNDARSISSEELQEAIAVFGTQYLETENLVVAGNSTNVYTVLLIHTIPAALPTGNYYIDFSTDFQANNATGVADIGFDSGAPALLPLTDAFIMGVHNNTDWYNLKQSFNLPHTTGQDTTFLAKFRRSTGAGTINVRNRKVKQWRIS